MMAEPVPNVPRRRPTPPSEPPPVAKRRPVQQSPKPRPTPPSEPPPVAKRRPMHPAHPPPAAAAASSEGKGKEANGKGKQGKGKSKGKGRKGKGKSKAERKASMERAFADMDKPNGDGRYWRRVVDEGGWTIYVPIKTTTSSGRRMRQLFIGQLEPHSFPEGGIW